MAKPLTSEEPGQPKSMQFAHFGVLNDGAQSKTSTMTAVAINVLLAFVIVVVGAATKKTIDNREKLTELTAPIPIKKIEPIKPKVIPPKPPPKLPEIPKVELQTPKIIVPPVQKMIEPPKPVKMEEPKPVVMPAPPKIVVAQAAPKVVNLAATPPALANNSAHPSAVALGSPNNPLPAPTTAGPSRIDLGNKGVAGMPSSNTGLGKPTPVNIAGSGTPGGSNRGTGTQAVQGVKLGVPGGTGPLNSTGRIAGPVNLAVATPPPSLKPQAPTTAVQRTAPKVVYKPKPDYTPEAIQMHLEGTVTVHIHVLPNGTVEVVGVTNSLGHGLDESAKRAAAATRFEPATDASGHPIEWDGFVNVSFQLAG
jgi:periplasmic protein TonB